MALGYSYPCFFYRETLVWKMSASQAPQMLLAVEIRGGFCEMLSFERQINNLLFLMFLMDLCFLG